MSDRTVHTARIVIAALLLTASILAQLADAPPWVGVLTGSIAAALALVSRLEVAIGADLDGDGRIGPRGPRLPIWLVAGAGLALSHCGGGIQAIDIGEPAGYLGSTGYAALTLAHGEVDGDVDGEIQADISVPVCVDVGGGLCVSVRVYGVVTGGSDLPEYGEVCAEVRAWGQVLAVRCVGGAE